MYATWCHSFRIMTWLCVLSVLIRNYIETWLREISALNCECLMLGLFGVKKSRKRWERGVYQVITRAPKPHGLITLTIAQKGRERERGGAATTVPTSLQFSFAGSSLFVLICVTCHDMLGLSHVGPLLLASLIHKASRPTSIHII